MPSSQNRTNHMVIGTQRLMTKKLSMKAKKLKIEPKEFSCCQAFIIQFLIIQSPVWLLPSRLNGLTPRVWILLTARNDGSRRRVFPGVFFELRVREQRTVLPSVHQSTHHQLWIRHHFFFLSLRIHHRMMIRGWPSPVTFWEALGIHLSPFIPTIIRKGMERWIQETQDSIIKEKRRNNPAVSPKNSCLVPRDYQA